MENKRNKSKGGLYEKVNISVRTADILIGVLAVALIAAAAFAISHRGFTVKFDTDGGSYVAPVKVMYSETVSPADPVKEGYEFTGWYTDRDCTNEWSAEEEVTGSMTLYAGWNEK